ncbi:Ataxin 2 SM domain [Nakaseomyces glabratus]
MKGSKGRTDFNQRKNFNAVSQSSGSGLFHETGDVTRGFNDRLDYLLVNGIGSNVKVTTTAGLQYEGVLAAANTESTNGIDVVLKHAKVIDNGMVKDIDALAKSIEDTLLIQGEDVAEVDLKSIDFSLDEKWEAAQQQLEEKKAAAVEAEAAKKAASPPSRSTSNTPAEGKTGFRTDVDISRANKDIRERELQKWTPDTDSAFNVDTVALEDSNEKWDQFAVNEKKFGIKSSFDEHFYTTKINKDDPNYAERLKEAERIAKEIESQDASGNVHLAEDRGIAIDDSGMDEEDLYSGVDRRGDELLASLKSNAKPAAPKPKKYVPPTLRNQPHHMDPAIISSTGTKAVSPVTKHSAGLPRKEHRHKKVPNSKEAQIEELRKFSEKFKVPYDMPKDMPTSSKSTSSSESAATEASVDTPNTTTQSQPQATVNSGSNLKSDPSLPPKPVNKSSSTKSSVPPTPSTAKGELKKSSSSTSGASPSSATSPQATAHGVSPAGGRASVSSRRRNAGSFFGSKKLQSKDNVRKAFATSFNMFLKSKEAHDQKVAEHAASSSDEKKHEKSPAVTEQFFIEKPYFTAPTWASTVEKSFKEFFPDERKALQKAQSRLQKRQMNAMNAGMMGSHAPGVMNPHMGVMGGMGGRGNLSNFAMAPMSGSGANPAMMNSFGGMYMPFQPQPVFYPGMVPMMGTSTSANTGRGNAGAHSDESAVPSGSMSPQAMSPHIPPAYMAGAPMAYPAPPGAAPFHGMMGGMPDRSHGNYYHNNHGHRNNHHHYHSKQYN